MEGNGPESVSTTQTGWATMTSEQRIQNTANQHHCHHWACWTHQDQQSSAVSRQSRCNKQWRGNMINPSNCCVVSHDQHNSKQHNITQARPSSTLQAGGRSNHLKHNSTTVVAVCADTPTTILVSNAPRLALQPYQSHHHAAGPSVCTQ
jgi:hypothetical protein